MRITDAGLKHLKGLTNVSLLWIDHTQVTDAGLKHLQGLQKLQMIEFDGTQVGDAGFQLLAQIRLECVFLLPLLIEHPQEQVVSGAGFVDRSEVLPLLKAWGT